MNELEWELLTTVEGRINADGLTAFLEAEGISVQPFQEGFGVHGVPLTFGPFSEVQLYVPKDKIDQARALLEEYEGGVDIDVTNNNEEPNP
jgi:hypothetical protein